jgi:uncharacterized membrane protein YdjX (TVP38/TMEM64 family)
MSTSAHTPTAPRAIAKQVALVVLAIVGLLVLGRLGGRYVPGFVAYVRSFGALGPLVYILGYTVAMVAGIPASLLTLAAGAIFGIWAGTLWSLLGATLGASAAFLVARYVARSKVEQRVAREPRFAAIDRAIGDDGRRIVFLLRLSPAVPFTLLNYLLGLTHVRFIDFLVGSAGMLPGTVLYVYAGKVAGDVATATGGAGPAHGAAYYGVLALGLIATIAVTIIVTRIARRALDEAVGDDATRSTKAGAPKRA